MMFDVLESSMSPEDEDEYLKLPNSLGISASPVVPYVSIP